MKLISTWPAIAILSTVITSQSFAQSDHSTHGVAVPVKGVSSNQAQLTEGVVKKVDKSGGKVLLAHGPTPDGMPAMTMAYSVKDPAWMDKLAVGQKILFGIAKRGNEFIISQIEVTK